MALAARQLYFEAVKVGDELPPLVKPPVDRLQISRYVGAAQDWSPLYVDEPYARNAGFPSVLVPGMVAMGFLAELVADWLRGARIRRFQARFVKIVWPGDVLTCRGRVTERRFEPNGAYAVDMELWAENQRGELVVRGAVTAQLYYDAEDEQRQRSGQPPMIVTPQEEEARLAKLSRAQPPKAPPPPPPPRPKAPPPAAKVAPAKVAPAKAVPAVKPLAPVAGTARPPPPAKSVPAAVKAPVVTAPAVKTSVVKAPPAAPMKVAPLPAKPAPAKAAVPAKPAPPKPSVPAKPAAKPGAGKAAAKPVPAKSAAKPARSAGPPPKAARSAVRPARPAPKPARAKPKAAQPRPKSTARARSGSGAKPPPKKRR